MCAVATVTFEQLTRTHLHPVLVSRGNPAAIGIEHTDCERNIGGNLDHDGPVRLDWRITQDFLHALLSAASESGVGEIDDILVGNRNRLDNPQEPGRPFICRRLCRVRQDIDIYAREDSTVEVVDAADMQHAGALDGEVRVHCKVIGPTENHRRRCSRICSNHFGKYKSGFRRHDRQLCIVARIIDPDAVYRWRFHYQRVSQTFVGARNLEEIFDNAALTPAYDQAAGAILDREHRRVTTTSRRNACQRRHVVDCCRCLRWSGHAGIVFIRLSVLQVDRGIDYKDVTAAGRVRERAHERHDLSVFQFPCLHELKDFAVCTGVVAVLTVKQLEIRAIRIHPVKIHRIIGPHVIPAAEYNLAVGKH